MELGEYPENPRLLRLDHVIQETVAPTRADYEKQGLTIYMQLSPAAVYADPLQVRRIITNILENSLKYKDKEKGTVWIRLEQTKQGCCLIFLDDGPGVPKAALPHLFDVFYRSDPARQNPDKGSGLGLAIVANAVQRMGGAVQAFCGQPQGLGIRIDLPLGNRSMAKILIVEDDGAIAAIERDYLELDHFEVEIAPDGVTGLNRGLSGEFDLILLDLMLPGMDGFSICRQLREKLNIPILMVTARQEDIDKIRGLGLGADDYIEKPFSPSVLVARVKTLR